MENSRCQSVGLVFSAAAYEPLEDNEFRAIANNPPLDDALGVATRVPSGV